MRMIPLRQLLREPVKVKGWTRAGEAVQVTDNGKPLWIIQPVVVTEDETTRRNAIDAILDEVLREAPAPVSAARLLEESRR